MFKLTNYITGQHLLKGFNGGFFSIRFVFQQSSQYLNRELYLFQQKVNI